MVLALRPFHWADNPFEIIDFIFWSTCSWLSGPFLIIYKMGLVTLAQFLGLSTLTKYMGRVTLAQYMGLVSLAQ